MRSRPTSAALASRCVPLLAFFGAACGKSSLHPSPAPVADAGPWSELTTSLVGGSGGFSVSQRPPTGDTVVRRLEGLLDERGPDTVWVPEVLVVNDVARLLSEHIALGPRGELRRVIASGDRSESHWLLSHPLPRDVAHGGVAQVTEVEDGQIVARMRDGALYLLGVGDRADAWFDLTAPATIARQIAGGRALCAILSTGGVRCWHDLYSYEISTNGPLKPFASDQHATDVESLALPDLESLSGGELVCAIGRAGEVACARELREVRAVSYEPIRLIGAIPPARAVVSGGADLCLLGRDGSVHCVWGPDVDAPVGPLARELRLREALSLRGATDIVLGDSTREETEGCARWASGVLRCWGRRMRDGNVDVRRSPTPIVGLDAAQALAVRGTRACAVQGGGLYCWGTRVLSSGAPDRSVSDAAPRRIPLRAAATSVALGEATICVTLIDGSGWCWNETDHEAPREVTRPDLSRRLHSITAFEPGEGACALDQDDGAWCLAGDRFERQQSFDHHALLASRSHFAWVLRRDGTAGCLRVVEEILQAPYCVPEEARDLVGFVGDCAVDRNGGSHCQPLGRAAVSDLVPGFEVGTGLATALGGGLRGAIGETRSDECLLGVNGRVACTPIREWSERHHGDDRSLALLPGLADVVELRGNARYRCARQGGGRVLCWGVNEEGSLTHAEAERSPRLVPFPR